jgi:multiple sugar transport system permease protein
MITQRELDLLAPPPGPGLVTLPARAALPAVRRGSAAPSRLLGWGFVAPALALLLALNIFPLAFNVYLSFTDADLSGGKVNGVGARNYTVLFADARYASALTVTATFVLLSVSIELVLGFVLALALRDRVPGKPVVLTILLIPMMLCPVVLSLFWNLILNANYGALNQLLGFLHLPQPQWLTDDHLKLTSILLVDVWMWTPFMMLISLAGLNAIPRYIYEAAEIDRASRWVVFRTITLPMCAPLLGLAVLLRATDALKQFDLVMAITGPNDATTQTLSARIYQVVFRDYKVGLGSAYGVVILVAVIAVATIFVRYVDGLNRQQGKVEA